ncbi:PepSY-like domain-containing protein [Persicitalea sp.]|uniref:PepSY-like domain-containing protein n=1 Tax=Persicitalea sp. TaxID=3100273 RepID=UPI003593F822
MKRMILVALMAATVPFGARAQKVKADKVPAAVKTAFAKAYPTASDVEWEKEKNGDFEVEFEQGKVELSVVYNPLGVEQEVEQEIKISELPAAVQAALKGKKIKEAAIIKKGGQTYYEAEVGGKDLIFDASGKPVKME